MAKSKDKTNAMRILDDLNITYGHYTYECKEFSDGVQIADMLSLPREKVYKTLVTKGSSGHYFVFVIPVAAELDRKKAAKSVGEKSVELLPVKDLNAVTGYIRGGCTAIGMKKPYVTRLAKEAESLTALIVSGGKLGFQIELSPRDFLRAAKAEFADITVSENTAMA